MVWLGGMKTIGKFSTFKYTVQNSMSVFEEDLGNTGTVDVNMAT